MLVKEIYEKRLEQKYAELKYMADTISRDMKNLADRIDSKGVNATINSIGELQDSARKLDGICNEIGHIKSFLDAIEPSVGE